MNIDYENLERDIESGALREELGEELLVGFRQIRMAGERLPTASHYASQIAEIVHRGSATPLSSEMAFNMYQEILLAVEKAREVVMSEPELPA
jgi:hypothetical protein